MQTQELLIALGVTGEGRIEEVIQIAFYKLIDHERRTNELAAASLQTEDVREVMEAKRRNKTTQAHEDFEFAVMTFAQDLVGIGQQYEDFEVAERTDVGAMMHFDPRTERDFDAAHELAQVFEKLQLQEHDDRQLALRIHRGEDVTFARPESRASVWSRTSASETVPSRPSSALSLNSLRPTTPPLQRGTPLKLQFDFARTAYLTLLPARCCGVEMDSKIARMVLPPDDATAYLSRLEENTASTVPNVTSAFVEDVVTMTTVDDRVKMPNTPEMYYDKRISTSFYSIKQWLLGSGKDAASVIV
ncbi:hypothetical protein HDU93_001034 [Gonapodya sp. JEL0774]|nr:hypothetical protein HDU93_001034 [Gonapodya sp. JEL0774]